MSAPDGRSFRLLSVPVISWCLYDFANTIFSFAVVTRYFNEWVLLQRGQPDWTVGLTNFLVSLALVVSLPTFGALADVAGRRKPLLAAFTALCVTMTALLGLIGSIPVALAVAGVAVFAFNSALAHYDPLLAQVAPPERQGRVSGVGVGLGYVGVMLAVFVLGAVVGDDNQAAFLPTAVLFGVFALPCLLFVRERGERRAVGLGQVRGLAAEALTRTRDGLRAARHASYGRFLLARFFYVDAVATVIAFMTVYAKRTGLDDAQVDALLTLSIVFAAGGALVAGRLAERIGPKRVLAGTVVLVVVTLVVTAGSGAAAVLWVAGPVVGVALGAVNASDRVLLLALTGEAERGEVFGLYALVGKVSSGLGPFVLWGGTIWLLSDVTSALSVADASRAAMGVLAAAALVGLGLLRAVPDRRAGAPQEARGNSTLEPEGAPPAGDR